MLYQIADFRRQLPPVDTSTHVHNLNFRIAPDVQRIGMRAVRDLSKAALFLSSR